MLRESVGGFPAGIIDPSGCLIEEECGRIGDDAFHGSNATPGAVVIGEQKDYFKAPKEVARRCVAPLLVESEIFSQIAESVVPSHVVDSVGELQLSADMGFRPVGDGTSFADSYMHESTVVAIPYRPYVKSLSFINV